jgi:hypothetical protein
VKPRSAAGLSGPNPTGHLPQAVLETPLRTTLRSAALALTAAVVLPVLPAVVAPTTAVAAPKAAAQTSVDWLVREARAKTTIAHLAARRAQAAQHAYVTASPANREPRRAAADHARRHAKATATIAHLARAKADRAVKASQPRASRSATRTAPAGVWDKLAQCESGGNWRINTGNGYYGGLQFSLSSWRAVGGSGYPHAASKAEQILRAERLKAKQGWGAWPACTRKLGLR